ncbi:MAG: glycosyltransferase family 2 protein [Gammaproteobacteria bacterium]
MKITDSAEMILSIVIPVYRSAEILPNLVEQIEHGWVQRNENGNFELIFVCDASPDNSWEVIEQLAKERGFVKGICLRKNRGQHNATMAGLRMAQGKYVVIMDDDLQHPPSEISRLIRSLEEGADVCYTRYHNRKHQIWKKLGSQFNNWVATLLLSKPGDLYLSSFKALRREIVDEIIQYEGPYPYIDGLILDVTRNIDSITIEHQRRHSGVGGYNLRRSLSLWLKMATGFSVVPLRITSILGLIIAFISFIALVLVVVARINHPSLPIGWPSMISTVLFLGGVQLVGLGIIGEYVGRTYLVLNGKPQYVIRTTTFGTPDEENPSTSKD